MRKRSAQSAKPTGKGRYERSGERRSRTQPRTTRTESEWTNTGAFTDLRIRTLAGRTTSESPTATSAAKRLRAMKAWQPDTPEGSEGLMVDLTTVEAYLYLAIVVPLTFRRWLWVWRHAGSGCFSSPKGLGWQSNRHERKVKSEDFMRADVYGPAAPLKEKRPIPTGLVECDGVCVDGVSTVPEAP